MGGPALACTGQVQVTYPDLGLLPVCFQLVEKYLLGYYPNGVRLIDNYEVWLPNSHAAASDL